MVGHGWPEPRSHHFIPNVENFLPWSWPSDHRVGDWHPLVTPFDLGQGFDVLQVPSNRFAACGLYCRLAGGSRWFQVVPGGSGWPCVGRVARSQQLVTLPAAPKVVQMSDFYLYNQQIVVEGFDQATLGCAWSEYWRCRAFNQTCGKFWFLEYPWGIRNPGIWDRNTKF